MHFVIPPRHAVPLVALTGLLLAAACGGGGGASTSPARAASTSQPPVTASRGAPDVRAFRRLADGWKTDFSRASVPASEFLSGGPGKDGIPAIERPKFVPVAQATFLDDREPVVAFELNGDARAYPVQILVWHELVDDVVGGEPVLISYCPLCNSAVVFGRRVAGEVYDFGVSGLLRNSDLVMFDRETESWWQQITGGALVGALTGAQLEFLPSETIAFADFRTAHPDGEVLSRDTGFQRDYGRNPYVSYDDPNREPFLYSGPVDSRLDPVDRVVTVDLDGESMAYPFSRLADHLVVNDVVGGRKIVVFYKKGTLSPLDRASIKDSKDVGEGVVYERVVDGRELTFEPGGGSFGDRETGSHWDITGRAVSGPLAGESLTPVVHGNHFWFAWAAFKPETRVWQP